MFIAKNNDLIVLTKETREELENALKCMVYTSIEETEVEYQLYKGQYLSPEDLEKQQKVDRANEIKIELDKIDAKSIRAIRANDTEYIAQYEQQAQKLRNELRGL